MVGRAMGDRPVDNLLDDAARRLPPLEVGVDETRIDVVPFTIRVSREVCMGHFAQPPVGPVVPL